MRHDVFRNDLTMRKAKLKVLKVSPGSLVMRADPLDCRSEFQILSLVQIVGPRSVLRIQDLCF